MVLPIAYLRLAHAGALAEAQAGFALGYRRLPIVNFSAAGHQSTTPACGHYVLAFNSEVYEHFAKCDKSIGETVMTGRQTWMALVFWAWLESVN